MKKLIYSLFICTLTLSAVSCMEIDNFDAPSARFSGTIIDEITGEPLLTSQGESKIRIGEMSFSTNPAWQDITIKQDGTFNNHRLFAGTYDVIPQGAWWPITDTTRNVAVGKHTTRNFTVMPYFTMTDLELTHEPYPGTLMDSLLVKCKMKPPVVSGLPQITNVRTFLSRTQFCGDTNKIGGALDNAIYDITENNRMSWSTFCTTDDSGVTRRWLDEDGLSMWVSVKVPVKPGYIYSVRMGARVNDEFKKYNYTEIKWSEIPQR